MESSRETGRLHAFQIFKQGGSTSPKDRWVILCLGLLNAVLLIVAVVIGINCAKVKEGSLHVSHSAAVKLISELKYLRSNHSDVIEAEEEAKNVLDTALKNHTGLKENIGQQRTINDDYQRRYEALKQEKKSLESNVTALEATCSKCPTYWILHNSCYFFSHTESTTLKKNWNDSRRDCIRRGGDMIVIDNQEEWKFVSDTVGIIQEDFQSFWATAFWIGLTDSQTEGTWVWINNVTEVEQRYWMDGEPSTGHLDEDCALVISSSNNPWKTCVNTNCDMTKIYWICEMTPK